MITCVPGAQVKKPTNENFLLKKIIESLIMTLY